MDNQHREIKGYRELAIEEIQFMNKIKDMGETLGIMIKMMKECPGLDYRWVSIAETHLQQGIMAAIRAIAQPTTF